MTRRLFLGIAVSLVLALGPALNAVALTDEETRRTEALIPLLAGEQELWAIGEFVHLGPPAMPVLAKALDHPNRRVRMNAIEIMSIIKDKSAVPILNAQAAKEKEVPAVREKALRVAIRLDPASALPALQAMAKDPSDSIRNAVAHESRHVRDKAVIDLLIGLLGDHSSGVADGAYRTLWGFTGRHVDRQDFAQSTQEQRVAWAQDWAQWWAASRDMFQFASDRPAPRPPVAEPPGGFPMPPGPEKPLPSAPEKFDR